jgi:hypothetical protein
MHTVILHINSCCNYRKITIEAFALAEGKVDVDSSWFDVCMPSAAGNIGTFVHGSKGSTKSVPAAIKLTGHAEAQESHSKLGIGALRCRHQTVHLRGEVTSKQPALE